ncbi:MAG: D-alanyl-D-alanine carboxypeptidase/D-alanyl-D-alanine-endopeptidase [Thermoleophilia bacterium]|nr:D-alanyl-D-alanine carboxypeptidase/D-alanyl-D-alanine-endopeptidase [Thermoleophilia bacterium]
MRIKTTFLAVVLVTTLSSGVAMAATPRPLPNPDRAAVTPRMLNKSAVISASQVCPAMRRLASLGNSAPGLRVKNLASGETVCSLHSRSPRTLASNTKIFTTSTTLGRLGADHRYRTRVFASGEITGKGVLKGNLYLKGGGDPTFSQRRVLAAYGGTGARLEKLATKVEKAGIKRVTGRLIGDDSVFDHLKGISDSGYGTSPYVGPLSGLSVNFGYTSASFNHFSSDPAKLGTKIMARELRQRGIHVKKDIALKITPKRAIVGGLIARQVSPDMASMARMTNKDSNNFFAEILLKNLGANVRGSGTTHAGTTVVERYAHKLGSDIHQVDGSGLSGANRSSPADVVKMLAGVYQEPFRKDFVKSLAIAGRDGTLADRMRGTAAQDNCHGKTGTITGVSALSGYCLNGKHKYAFSILMNGVSNLDSAHRGQDKIAALIARL